MPLILLHCQIIRNVFYHKAKEEKITGVQIETKSISTCFHVQLNLVDPNTVYSNYSVFQIDLSGPVFYPSYFN